jgi:hypothetical protein
MRGSAGRGNPVCAAAGGAGTFEGENAPGGPSGPPGTFFFVADTCTSARSNCINAPRRPGPLRGAR